MSARTADDWRTEFGIDPRRNPNFLSSKDDLAGVRAQAHVLRHAFDLLGLDGIFCSGNTPLIYFKRLDEIRTDVVLQLHRQFWNQWRCADPSPHLQGQSSRLFGHVSPRQCVGTGKPTAVSR